jgi:hypothetical protein
MNFAAARAWELLSASRLGTEILPLPTAESTERRTSHSPHKGLVEQIYWLFGLDRVQPWHMKPTSTSY